MYWNLSKLIFLYVIFFLFNTKYVCPLYGSLSITIMDNIE